MVPVAVGMIDIGVLVVVVDTEAVVGAYIAEVGADIAAVVVVVVEGDTVVVVVFVVEGDIVVVGVYTAVELEAAVAVAVDIVVVGSNLVVDL